MTVGGDAGADGRRIAVTLDDGYRDNVEHALPVFRRHGVPFTIYRLPGLLRADRGALVGGAGAHHRRGGRARSGRASGDRFRRETRREKAEAFRRGRVADAEADEAEQRDAIRALSEKHGLDLAALARELVMDWDEVRRDRRRSALLDRRAHDDASGAGAACGRHRLTRDRAIASRRSRRRSANRPTSLAFPYGYPSAAGAREARLAAQAGSLPPSPRSPATFPPPARGMACRAFRSTGSSSAFATWTCSCRRACGRCGTDSGACAKAASSAAAASRR